jgi:hypothetical protein
MIGEVGWIYTLHLAAPLGTTGRNSARHYTGWASDAGLLARLESHRSTYADAAIMRWCALHGIGWHVGALERGTRGQERKRKQHGAARRCWTCRAAA